MMKALIIYDDRTFAAKTGAMLQRTADNSDRSVRWNVSPWHIEMLKRPSAAIQVLKETADAHLVVLAFRNIKQLPDWLSDWLEQWANARLTLDAALALIRDGEADILLAPSTSDLSLFVKRHHLSFINDDGGKVEDRPEFLVRSLLERGMTLSPAIFRTINTPISDSYRGWGINE
jgi:hypothetical protein